MTVPTVTRPRVSPRQAIVVVYSDSADSSVQPAREPLLLDLLGTLVGVNGVSISVVATNRTLGRRIGKTLPAGVELFVPPEGEPAFGWIARKLVEKGFERILVVASDVVGLPVRVISTALSAIESDAALRADTPQGNPYLLGVSTALLNHESDLFLLNTLEHSDVLERVAPTRGLERFPRLFELVNESEFRRLVSANARLLPRLAKDLDRTGDDSDRDDDLRAGRQH